MSGSIPDVPIGDARLPDSNHPSASGMGFVRSSCPSAAGEGGARSARTSHGPSSYISFSKRRNTPRGRCLQWWALRGSNPRPPPCKSARGARDRPGHRVECCSDQRRRLSLIVVDCRCFAAFSAAGSRGPRNFSVSHGGSWTRPRSGDGCVAHGGTAAVGQEAERRRFRPRAHAVGPVYRRSGRPGGRVERPSLLMAFVVLEAVGDGAQRARRGPALSNSR